jgi:arsenate reductase
MTADTKVLFVGVHNAARSRIAEALLRELGGPRFEVISAGFEPHEANLLALESLAAIGLSLPYTGVQPSVFELFKAGRHFDYVIGVCDEEYGQRCPLFAGMTQHLYWSFPDPSSFTSERAAVLARIGEVRDAIKSRLEAWVQTLPALRRGTPRSMNTMQIVTPRAVDVVQPSALGTQRARGTDLLMKGGACGPHA